MRAGILLYSLLKKQEGRMRLGGCLGRSLHFINELQKQTQKKPKHVSKPEPRLSPAQSSLPWPMPPLQQEFSIEDDILGNRCVRKQNFLGPFQKTTVSMKLGHSCTGSAGFPPVSSLPGPASAAFQKSVPPSLSFFFF